MVLGALPGMQRWMASVNIAAIAAGIVALLAAAPARLETALALEKTLESEKTETIGWLRFEPTAGHLWFAQGNGVTILDASTGRQEAHLAFDTEPTALAFGAGARQALVALGNQNLLAGISLDSGVVTAEFASAIDFPSLAVFDPAAGRFFIASQRYPGLASVELDGSPGAAASAPPLAAMQATGRGWLFAAATGKPIIHVFDSLSLRELGRIPAPNCDNPSDLALDDRERRLYLACANGLLLVLDSDTGVVLSRQTIPAGASRLVVRTLGGRTVQAILLVKRASLAIFEGRIMASEPNALHGGLTQAVDLHAEQGNGLVFLATGSTVSVFDLRR